MLTINGTDELAKIREVRAQPARMCPINCFVRFLIHNASTFLKLLPYFQTQ